MNRRTVLWALITAFVLAGGAPAVLAQEAELSEPDYPALKKELPSPTKSIETYEDARNERIKQTGIPDWAVSAGTELAPFGKADFRIPNPTASSSRFRDGNPEMTGILVSLERFLIRDYGMLSVGVDGGAYVSKAKEPFDKMKPAIWSFAPTAHYELVFMHRQILVPSVRFNYQFLRYSYTYHSQTVKGIKRYPRIDIGMLLYLNFLEQIGRASCRERV